jgi:heptosyltransferase I
LSASGAGPHLERLLIVRLGAMGDVIHALPAVQVLRQAFPHAMIGWLIEERWAELLCAAGTSRRGARSPQRPLVEWVHTVDLRAWRKSLFQLHTLQQIATVWNDVRSVKYEIAVDLQGALRSAVLARLSSAPVIWGSSEPRESPASLWYTRQVLVRGAHVIEQNLSIAEAVAGKQMNVCQAELPYDRAIEQSIQCDLTRQKIKEYAILNPGAGWGAKRWPAERYGEVARQLSEDGFTPLVNFGPGEEYLAKEVVAASAGTARLMNSSISELIALTRGAKLFVGGDTGPMHLAAALGVPVVAIFGPTDPARNGPYRVPSIVLRNPQSMTSHSRRSQPDGAMLEISVDAVMAAARSLLTNSFAKKTHS